jgi:hypothetical protein
VGPATPRGRRGATGWPRQYPDPAPPRCGLETAPQTLGRTPTPPSARTSLTVVPELRSRASDFRNSCAARRKGPTHPSWPHYCNDDGGDLPGSGSTSPARPQHALAGSEGSRSCAIPTSRSLW